jgi:hypothetical protein
VITGIAIDMHVDADLGPRQPGLQPGSWPMYCTCSTYKFLKSSHARLHSPCPLAERPGLLLEAHQAGDCFSQKKKIAYSK